MTLESFNQRKIDCFKERFENFIHELEIDVQKQFPDLKELRKRLVAMAEVLEGVEKIIKKTQSDIINSLVGFDVKENIPPYKSRIVKIDDSSTAYECTDESIPSAI